MRSEPRRASTNETSTTARAGAFRPTDVCARGGCDSEVCVLNRTSPTSGVQVPEKAKPRTTAEIAFEMNATSHDIAQSVPAPARAIAFLKDLRRTNDDLRERLGRDRRHEADGTPSPRPGAGARERKKLPPVSGTPRS